MKCEATFGNCASLGRYGALSRHDSPSEACACTNGAIAYTFICPIFASLLILPCALMTSSLVFPSLGTVAIAVLAGFADMFVGVALFMYGMKRVSAHELGSLSASFLFGVC